MSQLDLVRQRLAALEHQGLRRVRRTSDGVLNPMVDGIRRLAFCSNDYLGLAQHPVIVKALQEGAGRFGAGSGASHLISGHHTVHAHLEQRLTSFVAGYIPNAASLYFSTGYMANVGLMVALAALDGSIEVFSEALNHASLIDGMRMARLPVTIYPHCDVQALEHALSASSAKVKVVVTDSVFSMDGNLAPLPQLLLLCQKYDAWLLVDDAHGFGVLGERGHGALEHFGLRSERIIYMGTLGKAGGVAGAFVGADAAFTDWLVQRARSYIYTTASPPALAHALLASLDLIEGPEGRQRRRHLKTLISTWKQALSLQQWRRVESVTAVQPVVIGSNADTLAASRQLFNMGFWVPGIRPPTVPAGTARLRVTLSAAHQPEDVQRLAHAVGLVETQLMAGQEHG